jgi:hypothetical protein
VARVLAGILKATSGESTSPAVRYTSPNTVDDHFFTVGVTKLQPGDQPLRVAALGLPYHGEARPAAPLREGAALRIRIP